MREAEEFVSCWERSGPRAGPGEAIPRVASRPSTVRPVAGGQVDAVDVAALRQRLSMTQERCARVFQIALPVVRNWEQGRNKPDGVATVILRMIEAHPKEVAQLLWGG